MRLPRCWVLAWHPRSTWHSPDTLYTAHCILAEGNSGSNRFSYRPRTQRVSGLWQAVHTTSHRVLLPTTVQVRSAIFQLPRQSRLGSCLSAGMKRKHPGRGAFSKRPCALACSTTCGAISRPQFKRQQPTCAPDLPQSEVARQLTQPLGKPFELLPSPCRGKPSANRVFMTASPAEQTSGLPQ